MATIASLTIEIGLDKRKLYRDIQKTQAMISGILPKSMRSMAKGDLFPVTRLQKDAHRAANLMGQEILTGFNRIKQKAITGIFDEKLAVSQARRMMGGAADAAVKQFKDVEIALKNSSMFKGLDTKQQTRLLNDLARARQRLMDPGEMNKLARSASVAQRVVQNANRMFDASRQDIMRKQAAGVLNSRHAQAQMMQAAALSNTAIASAMDKMAKKGLLTPAAQTYMVNSFRKTGFDAGSAMAMAAQQEFLRKWRTLSSAAYGTGRDMTFGVTLPLVMALGGAIKVMHDFEYSMNRAGAYAQATSIDIIRMKDRARELGRDTQFTASQVSDAFVEMTKAGFTVNDMLQKSEKTVNGVTKQYDIMDGVLKIAVAANMDMASAADVASGILQSYRLEIHEFDDAVNMLVKTFTSAKVDLHDLGTSFKYVGAIARQSGLKFEETAAFLGLFARAGIRGSMAGTALRGAINRINNPTRQVRDRLEKLKVTLKDTEGNLLPLIAILGQLKEAGAKAGDILQIFGLRAGPAMAVLVDQGIEKLAELEAKIKNHGNIADGLTDAVMRGIRGSFRRFKSNAEELAIGIGESGLSRTIEVLLNSITNLFQGIGKLPGPIRVAIFYFMGLTAAIGPALWGFGALSKAIYMVNAANLRFLKSIAVVKFAPWIIALTAVAALLIFIGRKKQQLADDQDTFVKSMAGRSHGEVDFAMANLEVDIAKARRNYNEAKRLVDDFEDISKKSPSGMLTPDAGLIAANENLYRNRDQWAEELRILENRREGLRAYMSDIERDKELYVSISRDLEAALARAFIEGFENEDLDGSDKYKALKEHVSDVIKRLQYTSSRSLPEVEVAFNAVLRANEKIEESLHRQQGGVLAISTEVLDLHDNLRDAIRQYDMILSDDIERNLMAAVEHGFGSLEDAYDLAAANLAMLRTKFDPTDGISLAESEAFQAWERYVKLIRDVRGVMSENIQRNVTAAIEYGMGDVEAAMQAASAHLQRLRNHFTLKEDGTVDPVDRAAYDAYISFLQFFESMKERVNELKNRPEIPPPARSLKQIAVEDDREEVRKRLGDTYQSLIKRTLELNRQWTDFGHVMQEVNQELKDRWLTFLESLPSPKKVMTDPTMQLVSPAIVVFAAMLERANIGEVLKEKFAKIKLPTVNFGPFSGALKEATRILSTVFSGMIGSLMPTNFFANIFSSLSGAAQPSLEPLNGVIERIGVIFSEGLAPVFDALIPVIEAFLPLLNAIVNILAPILKAFVPVIAAMVPILEAMLPVIKLVAIAFTYVAQIAFNLAGAVLKVIGFILRGIGEFIRAIGRFINKVLPGNPARKLVEFGDGIIATGRAMDEAGRQMFAAAGEMSRARDDIRSVQLVEPPVKRVADQFERLANLNIPEIFKLKAEQFRAISADDRNLIPEEYRFSQGTSAPRAQVVDNSVTFGEGSIIISGADKTARQLFDETQAEARRLQQNRTGTTRLF
jgi:TP901 family phage tail tape measure protein